MSALRRSVAASLLLSACGGPPASAPLDPPPPAVVEGQAPAPPLRRAVRPTVPAETLATLERYLSIFERAHGSECTPASELTALRLRPPQRTELSLPVRAGSCYRVIGYGLEIYDVDGSLSRGETALEQDSTYGPQILLGVRQRLCAERDERWKLSVIPSYGEGWVGLRAFRCTATTAASPLGGLGL